MRNVHEYSVDRATQSARVGATNPVRKYIESDRPPVIVQLAGGELHFYDQGGQPMRIEDVPQDILDHLRKAPLRRGNESPEQVLRFCPFCPDDQNAIASGQYEGHLEEHIRKGATSARAVAEEPEEFIASPAEVATTKKRAARKSAKKSR